MGKTPGGRVEKPEKGLAGGLPELVGCFLIQFRLDAARLILIKIRSEGVGGMEMFCRRAAIRI